MMVGNYNRQGKSGMVYDLEFCRLMLCAVFNTTDMQFPNARGQIYLFVFFSYLNMPSDIF